MNLWAHEKIFVFKQRYFGMKEKEGLNESSDAHSFYRQILVAEASLLNNLYYLRSIKKECAKEFESLKSAISDEEFIHQEKEVIRKIKLLKEQENNKKESK